MSSRLIKRIAALAAAGALATAACGSSSNPQTQPGPAATTTPVVSSAPAADTTTAPTRGPAAATSPAYQAFRETPTACQADPPPPVTPMTFVDHEDQGLASDATVLVVFETSCGDIEVELDPAAAPLAVNSFVFLARRGYFDGSVSHRIVRGFMFQAGDPSATGTGGPGYRIPVDEWPTAGFLYERGVVAMANAGPASTGSQFFIMLGDPGLPPNFTVIGRVVSGDDVLDAIADIPVTARPTGEVSLPLEALYLERVRTID